MTNEEAIEILKFERGYFCDFKGCQEQQAFTMAIRSLEAWEKVKAEIEDKFGGCSICEWFEDYDYEENDVSEYREVGRVSDIIDIIDKYKAESEDKE